jgi:superfamily II DNA or RNA helicase
MFNFDDLIARADETTFEQILGESALGVLKLLDQPLSNTSNLRSLVLKLYSPLELLRNGETRAVLLMLLPLVQANSLTSLLGASAAEPFEYLRGFNPRRGSEKEKTFLQFFGISAPEMESRDSLRSSVVEPTYGLFQHQRDAIRRVEGALDQTPHRALLHMPTGSGKTRTAMNIVVSKLNSAEVDLVVWLAYSEELCSQASEEFESAWRHLGTRPTTVHRFWGDSEFHIDDCHDGILVAGLSKVYARAKTDITFLSKLSDRCSLVIIDEAHQAVAQTYQFILSTLVERRDGVSLLGLSATPGRTWDDLDEDEKLSNFFGRKKITLKTPGSDPVTYLIDQGYLARPNFVSLPYSGTELSQRELGELAEQLDVSPALLRRVANDDARNLIVIRSVEALLGRHSRILVFAATVEHAESLAVILTARGHDATSITGTTPTTERQIRIQDYLSDSPGSKVLINFGVLTTGFDAPRTSAAVIARPTKSLVLYSQMVGRATRGPRAGGNKEAEIHTVVDLALPGFGEMSEAFFNWEDVWEDEQ